MKHLGLVAEYNPFHNGHAYQLNELKKNFPDKKIIVMMSGNFVQRGEPAIFEKSLRTECALSGGADIIFELPVYYAVASAEYFATAALKALAATGVIDTVCFGAECDDLSLLGSIADILCQEPATYQDIFRQYLSEGLHYPKARKKAVAAYLQDEHAASVLDYPNNILAIEYLKAIRKEALPLTPFVIKRYGSFYHSEKLTQPFPSATALRLHLQQSCTSSAPISSQMFFNCMPPACQTILSENIYAKPLFLKDFYPFIQYALWENYKKYEPFFDVSNELANHLTNAFTKHRDIESLILDTAGKNYTQSRIRRVLLHILLGITKEDPVYFQSDRTPPYLRLLGFKSNASAVLHEMKSCSSVPILNKTANAHRILSPVKYTAFEKELHIHALYKQIFAGKYGIVIPSDYYQSVIIQNL